ncbi:putative cytochrome p450 protein [Neofusicoccum parvum UCRNP2]|uniref:Putative cytochrome p450 protein n=1 Tax=Botryosphaeria parva (strain UCR-NP2) TaxID=1287680 RepID=R1GHJ0_BOTPV|nr:putative cytochrome p450 protein [Neofusicoccum parvum UCRNP2]
MASSAVFAILVTVILWASQALIRGVSGPLRKVPGPWYAPFTNLPLKWATITGRRVYFIDALHQQYGDVVRVAPNEVCFRDPATVKEIHRPGSGFRKDKWYIKLSGDHGNSDPAKHGLFTLADNKSHSARRKLLARAFSKSELRKNWEEEIRTTVNSYMNAVERIAKLNGICAELPVLKLMRFAPIPSVQKFFSSNESVMEMSASVVQNSRSSSVGTNIFTGILAEAEKGNTLISDAVLTIEARGLIVAGSDTTAITLTFLVWTILSRPQLHKQLVEELREKVPDKFTDEDLEKLPLMNAVIQEALRLYGAAPGSLPRNPPPGGATLGGFYMPEDVVVSTQAWSLHRNPDIWKDSEEFDVTRWLPGAKLTDTMRSSFSPFGWGSRMCLGIHIAETELRLGTATFFKLYPAAGLAPSTTPESMTPENFFIINPKAHQCKVLLKR